MPQQTGQQNHRPSVIERHAGPSLNIASAKSEQMQSVTVLNSVALGSRMQWAQVPPIRDSSPLDAKWEKASHIERQGPPAQRGGGGGGGGGAPLSWSGSQGGGDFSSKKMEDENLVGFASIAI